MSRDAILTTIFMLFVLGIPAIMVVSVYGRVFSGLKKSQAARDEADKKAASAGHESEQQSKEVPHNPEA